jgi:hypothetical protein
MGTNLRIPLITSPTIKTRQQRGRQFSFASADISSFFFSAAIEVEREKNDPSEENPYRPEETFPHRVSPLLGVIINPQGNEEVDERE